MNDFQELNAMLGKAKKFNINGKQQPVVLCTVGELEECLEDYSKIPYATGVALMKPDTRERLFNLLIKAFGSQITEDDIKNTNVEVVEAALDYFLRFKRD
jgi:hypothetical protein